MGLPEKLKSDTAKLHLQLEENNWIRLLTSGKISIQEYKSILALFFGYFSPLEQKLNQFESEILAFLPDFQERRKSVALLSDLEALQKNQNSTVSVSICSDLPHVTSLAEAFGCMYVIEGSTLGGRVISKHLNKALGLSAGTGLSFFSGYGDRTGERWSTFRKALQTFSESSMANDNLVIESANQSFLKFNNWLNSTNE